MDIQLKKGVLDICVLKSLIDGDSYGYKIIQSVSLYIDVSESTLYPILKRLEQSECLNTYTEEHSGRLRKYYSITDKGKLRIEEFVSELYEMKKVYDFILEGRK